MLFMKIKYNLQDGSGDHLGLMHEQNLNIKVNSVRNDFLMQIGITHLKRRIFFSKMTVTAILDLCMNKISKEKIVAKMSLVC